MLEQLMWTDYILLLIIFASTLLSLRKGFFDELFSILCIGTAIIVSFRYSDDISTLINSAIGEGALSPTLAMLATFFAIYITLSKITKKIVRYIKRYKLGILDTLLGIFFGFMRGVLIATIFVALALFSPYVKSDDWLRTPLTSGLQPLSDSLMVYLPDDVRKMLKAQVKDFEGSEFVNQTKKLFNVAFDADLDIKEEIATDEPEQIPEKTPEQLRAEQQQQLKELQKARLYREKMSDGRSKSDLQRPVNSNVNPEDLQNRLYQKRTGLGKQTISDRAALLLKQKELDEQRQIEEMKKQNEKILKEKKPN